MQRFIGHRHHTYRRLRAEDDQQSVVYLQVQIAQICVTSLSYD
jgi:hypothetical protein